MISQIHKSAPVVSMRKNSMGPPQEKTIAATAPAVLLPEKSQLIHTGAASQHMILATPTTATHGGGPNRMLAVETPIEKLISLRQVSRPSGSIHSGPHAPMTSHIPTSQAHEFGNSLEKSSGLSKTQLRLLQRLDKRREESLPSSSPAEFESRPQTYYQAKRVEQDPHSWETTAEASSNTNPVWFSNGRGDESGVCASPGSQIPERGMQFMGFTSSRTASTPISGSSMTPREEMPHWWELSNCSSGLSRDVFAYSSPALGASSPHWNFSPYENSCQWASTPTVGSPVVHYGIDMVAQNVTSAGKLTPSIETSLGNVDVTAFYGQDSSRGYNCDPQ